MTRHKGEKSQIDRFKEKAREIGADGPEKDFDAALTKVAGKSETQAIAHTSDCAVHNAPAFEAGACTCGAAKAAR